MALRGDGIGLEITRGVVRGIRLARDLPGRAVSASEVPIANFDDDGSLFDALMRTRARLAGPSGGDDGPTRIAWFPPRSTLQRVDVTGRTGPELNSLRHQLAESLGVTSTMLVDVDARRWLLALRWDHARVWRLQELAERAGFVDVTVEPAPVALERVLPRPTAVVRRDAIGTEAWVALMEGAVPIAAASIEASTRPSPGLGTARSVAATVTVDFEAPLPTEELATAVAAVAAAALDLDAQVDELGYHLRVLDEHYPPFPAHDPRAPQRVAVSLGAAVGAAGLVGRLRPVDVLTPTRLAEELPRPWAIERLPDRPLVVDVAGPPRRRRWLRRRHR